MEKEAQMSETNTDKILDRLANEPKSISVDNQDVTNPDITDVIKLAMYEASKAAMKKKRPFRITKMLAGGASC